MASVEGKKINRMYLKGSATEFTTRGGVDLLKIKINLDNGVVNKGSGELLPLRDFANDNGWVSLVIQERNEVDQFGNTHFVTLDEKKLEK